MKVDRVKPVYVRSDCMSNLQISMEILFKGKKKLRFAGHRSSLFLFFPSSHYCFYQRTVQTWSWGMSQSVWWEWVKKKGSPSLQTHQIWLFLLKGRAQQVARVRCTAAHQTVHPAVAPRHFPMVACCITHAAAHTPFKGMSPPFFKQE